MIKKRKKHHEEPENHERWLVSYADFITLLFAFFVVMYATSTNNLDKQKEFENSVRVNLKLTSASKSPSVPDAGAVIAEYIQSQDGADTFPQKGGSTETADYVSRYIAKKMDPESKKALGMEVRHDAVGVKISLAASAVFPEGEYKLKRTSLKMLNELGNLLKQTDRKIIVEGHTDDTPYSEGNITSNWELGSLRASSVVRYLIKGQNIDPKRLAAISYADQKPIAPNDTEENRMKNRRIEILISNQDPQ